MAAAPAFNGDDPILDGLSQEQLNYLNTQLTRHVNDAAAPATRVVTVNTRIDPPIYNPDTMSAASFFSKCEKYFRAQGYPENQYHNMIHTILKHNVKLWFDSVVNRIHSWDDFKQNFAQRFDKPSDRERRIRLLYTRKQRNESCEQYIQEMVTLARQIDDIEEETVSVNRAFHGLHPELILNVGCLDNLTINTLMEKLAFAYDAIRARDARNKVYTWLPPLYGYNVEKGPQFYASGGRGRGSYEARGFGRGHGYNPRSQSTQYQHPRQFYNQPGANYSPQVNQTIGSSQNQPRYQGQQQMQSQPTNNRQFRGNYQQHNNTQQRFQNNPTSYSNQHQNNQRLNHQNTAGQCRGCKQFGHFIRDCPQRGIANIAVDEGYQNLPQQNEMNFENYQPQRNTQQTPEDDNYNHEEYTHDEQQQNPMNEYYNQNQNSDPLNFQQDSWQGYGHGSYQH
ncbi:unnamed protein product [Orchesella dallaii]|uniref:CCHC-type domain-containing protein n=1 Tax=Orchesella dallaii TaxID=48710 RepID=A0ABP1RKR5_9HEXA